MKHLKNMEYPKKHKISIKNKSILLTLPLLKRGIKYGNCDNYGLDYYDKEKKTANPKLNEKGYLQVEKLAERCKNIKFDRIYCSDLFRASDTAK